jgi:hypothetical protein
LDGQAAASTGFRKGLVASHQGHVFRIVDRMASTRPAHWPDMLDGGATVMMADVLHQGLTALYAANGVALLAAYVPQARSVWRSTTGAVDVSLLTWCLWSLASTIAALYAHFVAHDVGYFLLSLGNAAGCHAIAGLTAFKRLRRKPRARFWSNLVGNARAAE